MEEFHETCFVHRELKPDNIVVGIGPEADKLFLIDLELAGRYCTPDTHEHIPYRTNISFVGNPIFASNNKLLATKVSRRDDLYSIGLMLVYFMRGTLPWSRLPVRPGKRRRPKSLFDAIRDSKLRCSSEELTRGLPLPVRNSMTYAEGLSFEARPDYEGMRQLFQQFSAHMGKRDVFPAKALLFYSCFQHLLKVIQHYDSNVQPSRLLQLPKPKIHEVWCSLLSSKRKHGRQMAPAVPSWFRAACIATLTYACFALPCTLRADILRSHSHHM